MTWLVTQRRFPAPSAVMRSWQERAPLSESVFTASAGNNYATNYTTLSGEIINLIKLTMLQFCFDRECVKMTILNCVDAEVACPYADGEYSCDCKLQDREIKTVSLDARCAIETKI